MRRILFLAAPLLAAGLLTSLSAETPPRSVTTPPDSPIQVTARLVTPLDIVIEWRDPAPGAAGHVLEWDVRPENEFVPLGFFRPDQNTHKHPDLMPETTNHYRVRAYYGRPSAEVEISLPESLTDEEYKRRFEQSEDYSWAGPTIVPDPAPVEKKSLRDPATLADAAPANFKITLMPVTVSAFKLTWTDRASDEEGAMIELKEDGKTEFEVVALVEPDVNSFGWAFGPPLRKGVMRVRPYYFGKPSTLVMLESGKEPPQAPESISKPGS